MKNYFLMGLAALALSGTGYAAEALNQNQSSEAAAQRQPAAQKKVSFELQDKRPIVLGVGVVDMIVSNLDFLHRYVERVPIERPYIWQEKVDMRHNTADIPSVVPNFPDRSVFERRGSDLGASLANKGIDYLLRNEFHTDRSRFDMNIRPKRGGAALYIKLTFN